MDFHSNATSKQKPTKVEQMTKEQIRQAIIKKRECNAKAQKIVESLLEKCIDENFFLLCLPDINQSHFEDVIEERCILEYCGYPLCQNTVSAKDIPKQKYRISIKTNKVYDITTRKNFCSNSCYKSAMHVKKQMLTSPLWFREYEQVPHFQLLPLDTKGSLGQEVDLGLADVNNYNLNRQTITPIINKNINSSLSKTNGCSIDQITDIESNNYHKKILIPENQKSYTYSNSRNIIECDPASSITDQIIQSGNKNEVINLKSNRKSTPNPLNIVGDIKERPEKIIDPILTNSPMVTQQETVKSIQKKVPQKKHHSITAVTIEVEKCLSEWFSLDTMLYLFGEEKVKVMVADKGECIKEYLNNYASSIFYNSNTYDQYQILCRKLNMLELEDRRSDLKTLARETKPLPDYSILQEESKKMQLKVKAFFAGETIVAQPDAVVVERSNDEENTTQLPLVDKNAQNALRRRIVCQHLDKIFPDILKSLGLSTITISSDIRLLVNTLKLKANNIMFKPIQWTLIAIVFIKLLSLRDPRLEHLLSQQTAFQHMQLLLLSYKQDGGYLERLISWLTDIDRLLDVNNTQLTIES